MIEAVGLEAEQFGRVVAGLSAAQWGLPTPCEPWRVRDLVAHVCLAIGRVPGMLAETPPARAEVSAVEYYRPDERFAPETNAARISSAQEHGAALGDTGLAGDFDAAWRRTYRRCRTEPADRAVRTRHGDPMLLSEFLVTRVVEFAIHGLDLATALGRPPWLTEQAGDVVAELLLGRSGTAEPSLGWDRPTFLRKATGREPMNAAEAEEVTRTGVRWLTLG